VTADAPLRGAAAAFVAVGSGAWWPPCGEHPMIEVGPKRSEPAKSPRLGRLRLWLLVAAGLLQAMPAPLAQTAPPTTCVASAASDTAPCPVPPQTGPEVWGFVGFDGYFTGLRTAPNGLSYDPLLSLYSDINVGLLPNKKLYLFLDNDFGIQRNSTRFPGLSQRQFDADYGLAWNWWASMEFRIFGYAFNNLNRGTSLSAPEGFKDGYGLENRYYFHYHDIYDISRLGYISVGYFPSNALVGNNGQSFKPSAFARGYLTESLPTPFTSYLFGGLGVTGESGAGPRLFGGDFGIAVRPVTDRQNLELRVGDAFNDDLKASETRNFIYGGVRLAFEAGPPSAVPAGSIGSVPSLAFNWPQVWGEVGVTGYLASSHMAPNGVPFAPLFSIPSDLNLGLLPQKKLYLFWDGDFWAQHSAPGSVDFSKREMDSNLGLAWNYFGSWELRGSVYALNNLNRGDSPAVPTGGKEGVILENRYNFASPDPYDVGRSSYLGLGYIPTENLVGGNGASFRPGPFARAYLARDLPIRWVRTYLYAGIEVIAEHTALPRLLDSDVGLAVRPIAHWQNLELRLGDDVIQDIVASTTRNMIYASIRFDFGPRSLGGVGGLRH
jgi:hypothetical protein